MQRRTSGRLADRGAVPAFGARYDAATAAYGYYGGVGAQWRNVVRGFDLNLDLRATDKLLAQAGEVIATVQTAMLAGPADTALRDAIFTHPTMAEGLNVLFANAPPPRQQSASLRDVPMMVLTSGATRCSATAKSAAGPVNTSLSPATTQDRVPSMAINTSRTPRLSNAAAARPLVR